MNYIGSKKSLIDFIDEVVTEVVESKDKGLIFADLFAGTGTVGYHFKQKGFQIIANDIQFYSYVLNKRIIETNENLKFELLEQEVLNLSKKSDNLESVLNYLQTLEGQKGFIYNNYTMEGTKNSEFQRQYFTEENAKLCDAIRMKIENWYEQQVISEAEYYSLIASLVYSMDQVANTASVYGAFLKKIKKTASQQLKLLPYKDIVNNEKDNIVYKNDINELVKEIKGDILYLDPPYNHRQYNTNYHILETIAKYDNPSIRGKTGLRNEKDKTSDYCSKVKALETFQDLIKNSNFKYIFMSYNNEGIISVSDIEKTFMEKGTYRVFKKEYNRFKANNNEQKSNRTNEYIHCCIVDNI